MKLKRINYLDLFRGYIMGRIDGGLKNADLPAVLEDFEKKLKRDFPYDETKIQNAYKQIIEGIKK